MPHLMGNCWQYLTVHGSTDLTGNLVAITSCQLLVRSHEPFGAKWCGKLRSIFQHKWYAICHDQFHAISDLQVHARSEDQLRAISDGQ